MASFLLFVIFNRKLYFKLQIMSKIKFDVSTVIEKDPFATGAMKISVEPLYHLQM